jgi:predicted Zn-dependent peptidase
MSPAPDLTFEKWRSRLQLCVLQDELLLVVAAYFGSWRPQDFSRLPGTLTAPIRTLDELHTRAVELAHAELGFKGSKTDWDLLRQVALVISAASDRARYLESIAVQS